jgi:hypothetical protein
MKGQLVVDGVDDLRATKDDAEGASHVRPVLATAR